MAQETHSIGDRQNPVEAVGASSDINSAAALRAQYAIKIPKISRKQHKKSAITEDEAPLVDTTMQLPLHSKKTERLQKKQDKKSEKVALQTSPTSLAELPTEILVEVLSCLRIEDVFRLSRTSRAMMHFVLGQETVIAKNIIRSRYWNLHRCFPLPISFENVPEEYREGLLGDKRQEMLKIHRKTYTQHVEMVDPEAVCTCLTCVFAWNNLCLLVDLHHWQANLSQREPIPMIPRGTSPEWNVKLLKANADIVRTAMERPLYYAAILEKHLMTITGTILRSSKYKKKDTSAKPRLYQMTDWDVDAGTDRFLDRKGPASYDFPFHRDIYYSLEAYLPNRKWDGNKWHYYPLAPTQHLRDLEWVKSRVQIAASADQRKAQALANLKDHNIRWSQYLEHAQQI